jgi:hypothetical protein
MKVNTRIFALYPLSFIAHPLFIARLPVVIAAKAVIQSPWYFMDSGLAFAGVGRNDSKLTANFGDTTLVLALS